MHHVLFSLNSCSCIVASHLGTIGEPCEGRAVGAEPEDGARVDQSRRRKDRPECMLGLG